MSESWDDYAENWDDDEDVVTYSEKAFLSLTEMLPLDGKRVLDFGCGTGLLTEKVSKVAKEVVGLDSSPKMIAILNNKKIENISTIVSTLSEGTIKSEKLLQEKFDIILASSVCAFLPDYEDALKLIEPLLVEGGVFVQWDWLITENNPDFGFAEKTVNEALTRTGFSDVTLSQPFSLSSSKGEMTVLMACAKKI